MSQRAGGTVNVNSQRSQIRGAEGLTRSSFRRAGAGEIYEKLSNGQPYSKRELPGGYVVTDKMFREFAEDLAEVLGPTRWQVSIEIHTDSSGKGSPEQIKLDNATASMRRSEALKNILLNTRRITLNQIQMIPKGDTDPEVNPELNDNDKKRNRRLVVRLLAGGM